MTMNVISRAAISAALLVFLVTSIRADDWPQWMGPKRDAVWREKDILDRFPKDGLKRLWREKINGGYSGPAVADGKVYVMDYVTDADTKKQSNPNARPKIKGKERVLCLDAKTGKELWKHEYDQPYEISYPAGPRCTPTVHDGKVYTLGAEGKLHCLDIKNKGKVIWSKDFKKDYKAKTPIWGFTSHPLIDGKKLICVVGGKGSVAVAFNKDTGEELWKAIDAEEQGYSPPTIITAAGKRQLLIWDADKINSLDPEKGTVYWSVDLKPRYNMSIMAPRVSGNYLFAGGIGDVSAGLELTQDKGKITAKELWRGNRTSGLSPINMTPFIEGETIYGFDQPGQLRAVDLKTGKRLWETWQPLGVKKGPVHSGTGFIVKNGERYFIFTEKGELILCKLSRDKYEEISRAKLLEPTGPSFGRDVVWTHPAFANGCVFARNDKEIVCYSLAK
jgi:outer membrane protein assembly factor BamB